MQQDKLTNKMMQENTKAYALQNYSTWDTPKIANRVPLKQLAGQLR